MTITFNGDKLNPPNTPMMDDDEIFFENKIV